jgi:hypothetical protein
LLNETRSISPDMIDCIVGDAEILTGSCGEAEIDRALATVMFTDIVDLATRAAENRRSRMAGRRGTSSRTISQVRSEEFGRRVSRDLRWSGARYAAHRAVSEVVRPLGIAVCRGPPYRRDPTDRQ